MTSIKLCGLMRAEDIEAVNILKPEYIGFVFAEKSKRCVTPEKAAELKRLLNPEVKAVGVFVDEDIDNVSKLLKNGTIDIAQLHGSEDNSYIEKLKKRINTPVIKAFQIKSGEDISEAQNSAADYVLLDSGKGSGQIFNWELIKSINRPYFLAGGLDTENIQSAIRSNRPFAVDVSSGIETDGKKDLDKMTAFVNAVRKEEGNE
ncbi:MAG: phosphoribosylanthranilate isomerase [Ruminococcus sp.]|nr:phosphoribosylanthranilate isomerase [Ruminococcus sp.]